MKWQETLLILYPAMLTIAGFCSMGIDKTRAKKKRWRIKEKTLFLIALFGGSVGSILGMYTFRHKTKHKSFVYGMPAILVLQIVLGLLINYFIF
jgi:uncharacterized membrane protein YsdA (DUF1294 family)